MTLYHLDSHVILKFAGVRPQGLNLLHDTIDKLNSESPFNSVKSSGMRVTLLSSKFSSDHQDYVVEIRVPYRIDNDQGNARQVPQSSLIALFSAIEVFSPQ